MLPSPIVVNYSSSSSSSSSNLLCGFPFQASHWINRFPDKIPGSTQMPASSSRLDEVRGKRTAEEKNSLECPEGVISTGGHPFHILELHRLGRAESSLSALDV